MAGVALRGQSTGCATTDNLALRIGPTGTETAVRVDRIRPCGCRPCPAYKSPDRHMRGREIPDLGPILSRFCSDHGVSRDNFPNLGSYVPLRDHSHHITNISSDSCSSSELRGKLSVPTETAFQTPLASTR